MFLETKRLLLEPWRDADRESLRPIATHPEVMRFITGGIPWTEEQIGSFVDRQVALYRDRGFCRWKLTEKRSGRMIGFCGPGYWRDFPEPEIGWWLARECWGRGLATEAAHTALRDAFLRAGLDRIVSIAVPENVASTGIMRKIGLRFECEFENEGLKLVRYALAKTQYEPLFPAERL